MYLVLRSRSYTEISAPAAKHCWTKGQGGRVSRPEFSNFNINTNYLGVLFVVLLQKRTQVLPMQLVENHFV